MDNIKLPIIIKNDDLPGVSQSKDVEFFENGINYRYTLFVPENSFPKMPLVVELHGGGGSGRYQVRSTAWADLAEKEGFIVLFPTANQVKGPAKDKPDWSVKVGDFSTDCDYIMRIIDKVIDDYDIDKERVYLAGMSVGDYMALTVAAKHGQRFAGLAEYNGPADPVIFSEIVEPGVPVPIIQIRGELDFTMPDRSLNKRPTEELSDLKRDIYEKNRDLWIKKNHASKTPRIRCFGDVNTALYISRETNCDVRYIEVKDAGHIEPMSSMQYIWSHCFSGYIRKDGVIERLLPPDESLSAASVLAMKAGSRKAYVNGEINDLKHMPVHASLDVPEDYWCRISDNDRRVIPSIFAALEDIALLLNAQMNGDRLIKDGYEYLFFRDVTLVIRQSLADPTGSYKHYSTRKQSVYHDGCLYVPAADVLEILGFKVAEAEGVLYASNEYSRLTNGFVRIIRDMLM